MLVKVENSPEGSNIDFYLANYFFFREKFECWEEKSKIALILIILASHTLFILEKINSKINFCIIMVTLDIILINLINKIENKNFNLKKRYLKFLIFFLRLLYILLSLLPIIIFLIAEMAMSYKFLIIFPLLILNGIILEISKLEYKKKKKFLKCYFGIILSHLFIIIYSTGKISKSIIIYLKKNILVPNNSDISYSLIIIICAISVIFMINNFVINLKEYQDKKNNYRKSKIDILKLILKKNKVSVEVKNLEEILSRIKEIRGEYDIKINWKIIIPITLINAVILFKIQHWNLKSMSDILWSKKDNILQLIEETLVVYKGIIYFSVFIFILILFIYPIWLGISFFKENIHQNKYISREKMMELEDILKDMMLLKLNDKSDET